VASPVGLIVGSAIPLKFNLRWYKESMMTKKLISTLALLGFAASLLTMAGCNTIAGAGKDIQKGGEAVRDTAKDVQKKM
jgi:predicted small secreted protein